MGLRKKGIKTAHKKSLKNTSADLPKAAKSETIETETIDFYGFSPRVFVRDLIRTALSTAATSLILVAIYWWSR